MPAELNARTNLEVRQEKERLQAAKRAEKQRLLEAELEKKRKELLLAGTSLIWLLRNACALKHRHTVWHVWCMAAGCGNPRRMRSAFWALHLGVSD